MNVLGVETSCDESGLAVVGDNGLLTHTVYSQTDIHAKYGGVVPELASRDHIQKLLPLLRQMLERADLNLQRDIHGIAYTAGPGLLGALLVGASIAQGLGWSLNKPVVGIHHMEAHLLAVQLEGARPTFPYLALLVSGGHTLLVQVNAAGDYLLCGQTIDDAVGEAFDKTAMLLGLGYPGGPALARLATHGDPTRYHFPRPLLNRPDCDFSFSGLKTHVQRLVSQLADVELEKPHIARAFEEAVVETLIVKSMRALEQTHTRQLVIAGGVGANQRLRQRVHAEATRRGYEVFFPSPQFCTDNGAMVAYLGRLHLQHGRQDPYTCVARPRWPIHELVSGAQ